MSRQGKRKRPCLPKTNAPGHHDNARVSANRHAVLSQLYSEVTSLREFVLLKLPASSKIRRRKITNIGKSNAVTETEQMLQALLDDSRIGITAQPQDAKEERWERWLEFSQRGDDSYVTLSDGLASSMFSQSEIVDFAIWSLFHRLKHSGLHPHNLLCDGFRKIRGAATPGPAQHNGRSIPGVYVVNKNANVTALKTSPWPELLALLGRSGESIMIDLLLDSAIFVPVNAGSNNYCQISGKPVSEAELFLSSNKSTPKTRTNEALKSPSDITFVRNRMLYARAALNARGVVHFGLRHIHVLNRSPHKQPKDYAAVVDQADSDKILAQNSVNTSRVMMYMFPRQFGLHNVFTSEVDFRETSQRLKDYTLREEEISAKFGSITEPATKIKLPKRLRGRIRELVVQFQVLHQRCSYSQLLQYYCPIHASLDERDLWPTSTATGRKSSRKSTSQRPATTQRCPNPPTLEPKPSLESLSTPAHQVSAFCQAVLKKVIPDGFWGSGDVAQHNKDTLLRKVNRFVRLRRFESLSLHEVVQGMKITEIEWLASPRLLANKTSQTDVQKRLEIFLELVYFIFDSVLVPLVRSNFYVTESSAHKYRLFFFRHDVWRYVAEPSMASLKSKMFEEVKVDDARRLLDRRQLGFSQVRLLPKETGMRPIMNLRSRKVLATIRGKRTELGPSINTILAPAKAVLQFEKSHNSKKLGASMFSVGDIYHRIKPFRSRWMAGASSRQPLYFAKLDVKGAFDTIPQAAVVGLLDSIPQLRQYRLSKHLEVSPNVVDGGSVAAGTTNGTGIGRKPTRRWPLTALDGRELSTTFLQFLESERATNKRNTVFADGFAKRQYEASEMLQLVSSHIQQNLVKIGKKFYRQKEGIPQGSVLSSMLCNYFYADLEAQVLSFLDGASDDCLLLRLIDDFLLITTDRAKATRFVELMHHGVPEYGVSVNPLKSLVNFDLQVGGVDVPRIEPGQGFPYCGTLIDCKTLGMKRAREAKGKDASVFDGLTVEFSRVPGQTFQRKVMNAFKIQSHFMFFDTSHNAAPVTLSNIYEAFSEVALKMWAYARSLPSSKRPRPALVIQTITNVANMAFTLLTSRARKLKHPGYVCDVRKVEVTWLAYTAFHTELSRRQAGHADVLAWLAAETGRMRLANKSIRRGRVSRVVWKKGVV